MSKLRLGFVGCGRISHKHFEALKELSDKYEIIAICDSDKNKLENIAFQHKVNIYTDLKEMLTIENLQIVTLATPNGFHAEQAILCAEHGVDVICEKPMAINLEDGLKIKNTFERLDRNFFLVHQNRYNEPIKLLKEAIDKGLLGKIYLITSNVFWQRPQEYYDKESWHGTKALDGGAFMTQASHYIDLVNWLVNNEVEQVYATLATLARNIETEDTGSAIIKWKNGTLGNINVTVLTYPKNLEGSITIIGEKGTVKIGGVALNEILHWEIDGQILKNDLVQNSNYQTESVYGYGHKNLYEKIFEYYNSNGKDIVNLDSALKSLKILCAILESDKLQQPVNF